MKPTTKSTNVGSSNPSHVVPLPGTPNRNDRGAFSTLATSSRKQRTWQWGYGYVQHQVRQFVSLKPLTFCLQKPVSRKLMETWFHLSKLWTAQSGNVEKCGQNGCNTDTSHLWQFQGNSLMLYCSTWCIVRILKSQVAGSKPQNKPNQQGSYVAPRQLPKSRKNISSKTPRGRKHKLNLTDLTRRNNALSF